MKTERVIFTAVIAFLAGIALTAIVLSLNPSLVAKSPEMAHKATNTTVSETEKETILERSAEIYRYFMSGDYSKLSNAVHPVEGVIFVPYTTIDTEKNLRFSPEEVKNFDSYDKKLAWGIRLSSGDSIELTPDAYIDEFVCGDDYISASVIGQNTPIGVGSRINNITDIFPMGKYVEFYIDGTNGVGWHSLTFVFEDYMGEYMLVAVIHGEWTI